MYSMPEELTEEYDDVEDIATSVIEGCKEAQDTEEPRIPITAIDEAELPKALVDDVSQDTWDWYRQQVKVAVMEKGYDVT